MISKSHENAQQLVLDYFYYTPVPVYRCNKKKASYSDLHV
jgi:hypothetical protein